MSNQKSRKQLIIKKYVDLQLTLNECIDSSILPSLDDIDIIDLIFYFNLVFPCNEKHDYKDGLKSLLDIQGIKVDNDKMMKVYEIVRPFIIWFRELE